MMTPEERASKNFSGCFCRASSNFDPPGICDYCVIVEEIRDAEAAILEEAAKGFDLHVSPLYRSVSRRLLAMARERREGK